MGFWLIWDSLAMVTLVGASFTAGFITCKLFGLRKLKLRNIKNR